MPPLLEVKNLRSGYGPIDALTDVSLTVDEGEIVTIIGANGAGKTTTLLSICGSVRARSGEVNFNVSDATFARVNRRARSEDVTTMTAQVTGGWAFATFVSSMLGGLRLDRPGMTSLKRLRADQVVRLGIAQSPEGRKIFPRLSVLENLQMGAFTRTDKPGIADDLEKMFAMFPILKERKGQAGGLLSGGQQQMLAIARALMSRPKLLLLDEPSLGLAPQIVTQIFDVIRDLNGKQGMSVLLVEQNARMALKVAHRGYVLETGRVTLTDKASVLLNDARIRAAYLGE